MYIRFSESSFFSLSVTFKISLRLQKLAGKLIKDIVNKTESRNISAHPRSCYTIHMYIFSSIQRLTDPQIRVGTAEQLLEESMVL